MIELAGTLKNYIQNFGGVEASAATGRDGLPVYSIKSKKQYEGRPFVACDCTESKKGRILGEGSNFKSWLLFGNSAWKNILNGIIPGSVTISYADSN